MLVVLGFLKTCSLFLKQKKDISFLKQYLQKLNEQSDYDYIQTYAPKVQRLAGYLGLVNYRASHGRYYANNYQIIINTIRQLTSQMGPHPDDLCFVLNTLSSVIGESIEELNKTKRDLLNPLIWLKESFKLLLSSIPFILKSVGLITPDNYSKSVNSRSFEIIVGFFTIISAIIGILGSINS